MNYIFFDTDLRTENDDYTIEGADYEELIRTCFRYSEYFSVWFSHDIQWTEELKPYEVEVDPACFEYAPPRRPEPQNIGDILLHLHFYRICPELYRILIENTHSVWDGWNYDKPAFKHFYRSDGSCFFMSYEHEGNCFFYLRDGEDVSSVVGKEHWYRAEELWPNALWSPRPDVYRQLFQEDRPTTNG